MKGMLEILGPQTTMMKLQQEVWPQQEYSNEYGNDGKMTIVIIVSSLQYMHKGVNQYHLF